MAHSVEYILKIATQNTEAINRVAGQTENLTNKVNAATGVFKKLGGVIAATFAVRKISSFSKEAEAAYTSQSVSLTKLRQVMTNTMDATKEQFGRIIALTDAQENLGVVSGDVQVAGAQELATYLTMGSSLEKLIPVMNDMVAQQYGLNASQEQAISIASMMGKVMDGQVGALSRYGYKFTEAQERILKYGTEAQRAATLADVVSSAVGGVNEAIAATPEGKEKQQLDRLGKLQERYGKLYITIKSMLMPVRQEITNAFSGVIDWLERNSQAITKITGSIITGILSVFDFIGSVISRISEALTPVVEVIKSVFNSIIELISENSGIITGIIAGTINLVVHTISAIANVISVLLSPIISLIQAINDGNPVVTAFAIALGTLAAAMTVAYIISSKQLIVSKAQTVWLNLLILKETLLGKAIATKNKLMTATPWGLAAAGIAGLITLIGRLTSGFSKFGRAQKAITDKAAGLYASERLELDKLYKQLQATNAGSEQRNKLVDELKQLYPDINSALETELRNTNDLTLAYEKLTQEAKRSALERAKLEVLEEESKKLFKLQFEQQQRLDDYANRGGFAKLMDSFSILNEDAFEKLSNAAITQQQKLVDRIAATNVFGGTDIRQPIGPMPWVPGTVLSTNNNTASTNGNSTVDNGNEAIVTGGSKSTNINITIGNVVEKMSFTSTNNEQNLQDMQDRVLDALIRAINMSQAAAL